MMMNMVEYCHLQCRWGKCMYFWMKNQNFCRKVFDNLPPAPQKTLFASGVQSFVRFDCQLFALFVDSLRLFGSRAGDLSSDGRERPPPSRERRGCRFQYTDFMLIFGGLPE